MTKEKTPWYRRIPGYRSKTPWKMLVATIIYIVILNGITQTTGDETASDEENEDNATEEVESENTDEETNVNDDEENEEVREDEEEIESEQEDHEERENDEAQIAYENEIRDYMNEAVAEFDAIWEEDFQALMSDMESGNVTDPSDAVSTLRDIHDDYIDLDDFIYEQDIPESFSEEQSNELRSFQDNMIDAVWSREDAVVTMYTAMENNALSDSVTNDIVHYVEESDDYVLSAAASWTTLRAEFDDLED